MSTKSEMCDRPVYVYRLAVEYPDGIDWRNPPDAWEETWIAPDDTTTFHWPRLRRFLSKRGAENLADLLRSYGCIVTIERSARVEFPA